jgi:hypothetical protein
MKQFFLILMLFIQTNLQAYKYDVSAVLIFQNETFFLKEWIEYHKLIGVEHFYLFDNCSTDNPKDILKPYIDSGLVEYDYDPGVFDWNGYIPHQCQIYTKTIEKAANESKWLAIIDADEFIYPVKGKLLKNILKNYEEFGGVYLNHLAFGTSNTIVGNRLIIEALDHCSLKPTQLGKSIVRPDRVLACTDPHRMWYKEPYYHVNTSKQSFDWLPSICDDVLLLHHYCVGDLNYAMTVKYERYSRWKVGLKKENFLRIWDHLNVRKNNSMKKFTYQLNYLSQ